MIPFDEKTSLTDLRELYPDPPHNLVVSSPPLIHHGYFLGHATVCVPALKECLEIAKKRGDQAAVAHLRAHAQAYAKWKKERTDARSVQESATRRSTGPRPQTMPSGI